MTTGEAGTLRAEAHTALDEASPRDAGADELSETISVDDPPHTGPPPDVGATVRVGRLGLVGRLLALHDAEAEVDVRGKRLRVPVADLRVASDAGGPVPRGGITVHTGGNTDESLPELNVIGCTVDDAVTRTEKYLDQAVLREQRQARVVHGHGTGALRRAIGALLEAHPQVARFAPAPRDQGGAGVTVVDLKD